MNKIKRRTIIALCLLVSVLTVVFLVSCDVSGDQKTTETKFKVNFYLDGSILESKDVEASEFASLAFPTCKKENTIYKWYLDYDLTKEFNLDNFKLDKELSLYAKEVLLQEEVKTCNVTVRLKDDKNNLRLEIITLQVKEGTKVKDIPYDNIVINDYPNYEIIGFENEDKIIESDDVIYVKYRLKSFSLIIKDGSKVTTSDIKAGELVAAPTQEESIFNFVGWFDEEGNEINFSSYKMPASDVTISAKYSADEINCELVATTPVMKYGQETELKVNLPENITESNIKSVAWYKETDGETEKSLIQKGKATSLVVKDLGINKYYAEIVLVDKVAEATKVVNTRVNMTKATAEDVVVTWANELDNNYTYTGNRLTPSVVVKNKYNNEVLDASLYTVSYGDLTHNCIDVESGIIATVTLNDSTNYTSGNVAGIEHAINVRDISNDAKAKLSLTYENVYTGKSIPVVAKLTYKDLEINTNPNITFYKNGELVADVIDAGTYNMVYDVTDGSNKNIKGSINTVITINRADLVITANDLTTTYDGENHDICVETNFEVDLNKTVKADKFTGAVDAGVYNIDIVFDGNPNINAANKKVTLTINKATSLISLTNNKFDYTGDDKKLNLNFTVDNSEQEVVIVTESGVVNAGEYQIVAKVNESKNYLAKSQQFTVVINPIKATVKANNQNGVFNYNKAGFNNKDYEVSGLVQGDSLKVALGLYKENVAVVSDILNAGNYEIKASVEDDSNYVITIENAVFNVEKKELEVSDLVLDEVKTFTYSGEKIPYNVTSTQAKLNVVSYKNSIATPVVNAGKYDIVVESITSDNLKLTNKLNVAVVTVNKKQVEVPVLASNSKVYDGVAYVLDNKDSYEYVLTCDQEIKDVDNYTIKASLKDKANYIWTDGTEQDKTNYTFKVIAKDLSKEVLDITLTGDTTYTGNQIKPSVQVSYDKNEILTFTTKYENNVDVTNNAKVTITFSGNYSGSVVKEYEIKAKALSDQDAVIKLSGDYTYTGSAILPNVVVEVENAVLDLANYDVKITNNVEVGDGLVTVTFKGNYSGEKSANFTITAKPLTQEDVVIEQINDQTYTSLEITPAVIVKYNGKILSSYSLVYSNNIKATENAGIEITFNGNYSGVVNASFKIVAKNISVVWTNTKLTYNYSVQKPTASLQGVEGEDVVNVEVNANGKDVETYVASAVLTGVDAENYNLINSTTNYVIEKLDVFNALVTIHDEGLVYDAKAKEPTYEVSYEGKEVTYVAKYSNNTNAGQATLTLTFNGNFKGSVDKNFTINKAKVNVEVSGDTTVNINNISTASAYLKNVVLSATCLEMQAEVNNILSETIKEVVDGNGKVVENFVKDSSYSVKLTFKESNFEFTANKLAFNVISNNAYVSLGDAALVNNKASVNANDVVEISIKDSLTNEIIEAGNFTFTVNGEAKSTVDTSVVGIYTIVVTLNSDVHYISNTNIVTITLEVNKCDLVAQDLEILNKEYSKFTWKDVEFALPTYKGNPVDGTWTIDNEDILLNKGRIANTATFTPSDVTTYNTVTINVVVEVVAYNVSADLVVEAILDQTYQDGKEIKPSLNVTLNGQAFNSYSVVYSNNIDVTNSAKVTITANGNYEGTKEVTFNIVAKDASAVNVVIKDDLTFTGKDITPTKLVVTLGEVTITNSSYDVSYLNNVNVADDSSLTLTFKGNYKGSKKVSFDIVAKDASSANVVINDDLTFTGNAINPSDLTVSLNGVVITTYTLEYGVNTNVADNSFVKVVFNGNYKGSVTKNFDIVAKDLTNEVLVINLDGDLTYTGNQVKPNVSVSYNGTTITTFTVKYVDNVNVLDNSKVVITFNTNYAGAVEKTFEIVPYLLSNENTVISYSGNMVYTSSAINPTVEVSTNGHVVNADQYDLVISNNINVSDTPVVEITFKNNYKGTATSTFTITAKDVSNATINVLDQGLIYNGQAQTPNIEVLDGDKVLNKEVDYKVTYANNTNAGNAVVSVKFVGNYKGEASQNFVISKKTIDAANSSIQVSPSYIGALSNANIESVKNNLTDKDGLKVDNVESINIVSGTNAGDDILAEVTLSNNGNFAPTTLTIKVGTVQKADLTQSNFKHTTLSVEYKLGWDNVAINTIIAKFNGNVVEGVVAWKSGEIPALGKAGTFVNRVATFTSNNANFNNAEINIKVNVVKRDASSATIETTNFTYNALHQQTTVKVMFNGEEIPSEEYTVTLPQTSVAANTYNVSVNFKENANYKSNTLKATYTINKYQLTTNELNKTDITFVKALTTDWNQLLTIVSEELVVKYKETIVEGIWSFVDGNGAIAQTTRNMKFVPNNTNFNEFISAITFNEGTVTITNDKVNVTNQLTYNAVDQKDNLNVNVFYGDTLIDKSLYTLTLPETIDAKSYVGSIKFNDGCGLIGSNSDGTLSVNYTVKPYVLSTNSINYNAGNLVMFNGKPCISHSLDYKQTIKLTNTGWLFNSNNEVITIGLKNIVQAQNIDQVIDITQVFPTFNEGGTYYVAINKLTSNYVLDANQPVDLFVKIATVRIGSTFYTMEDAISKINNSGETAFVRNNTKFADVKAKALYNANCYTLSNGTIVLPYKDSTGNLNETTNMQPKGSFATDQAIEATNAKKTLGISINLTMQSHIDNFNINGTGKMLLSGQRGATNNGATIGYPSQLTMEKGSVLNINGGTLDVLGFVIGKEVNGKYEGGEIIANSGNINEVLTMGDFSPGGTHKAQPWKSVSLNALIKTNNRIVPFNQFSLNNIEVSTTIKHNATLSAYWCLYISGGNVQEVGLEPICGPSAKALFQSQGNNDYVVKRVDNYNFLIDLYGNYITNSFKLSLTVTLISVDIDTALSEFPVSGNMRLHIKSGSTLTMNKRFKLMPGASIVADEGSTVNIEKGGGLYAYMQDPNIADNKYVYRVDPDFDNHATLSYCSKYPCVQNFGRKDYKGTIDYDVNTPAKVIINGTINVMSGGKIGGLFTSTASGKVVINQGANINNTVKEVNSITGGMSSCNMTMYENTLKPYIGNSDGSKVVASANRTYQATNGIFQ